MTNCKPVSTPMCVHEKLSRDLSTPLGEADIHTYQSTVGALQYLTLTRLDISFAVNKVCQYLSQPTNVHWEAVKRIPRFINGTVAIGLHIRRSRNTLLSMFIGADWAGCADDWRSTGGSQFSSVLISSLGVLGNNLIFPDRPLRQNTKPWQMVLQRLLGFSRFHKNFMSHSQDLQFYGVIIWVLRS